LLVSFVYKNVSVKGWLACLLVGQLASFYRVSAGQAGNNVEEANQPTG